jgi:hypothetical protein
LCLSSCKGYWLVVSHQHDLSADLLGSEIGSVFVFLITAGRSRITAVRTGPYIM